MTDMLKSIAESRKFQNFIIGVIFLSSILVGLETYPYIKNNYEYILRFLEQIVLFIFTVEIIIRIGAHGKRPWDFFRDGWNIFDFTIVALLFLPTARSLAVLRLVRVMRILRLIAPLRESEIIRQKNIELEEAYRKLEAEKAKSERLLLNILPALIAQRLKKESGIIADTFFDATVLFADIVKFTRLSEQVSAEELVTILDDIFSRFDRLSEKYHVEKIKTLGDAYMVVAGVPEPRSDHREVIANMALEMQLELAKFNQLAGKDLEIRIGFHAGPLVAGVIGRKKFSYDLWGDTVNTASRMESHGVAGKIQVTEVVYRSLRDRYEFEPRGMIDIKGKGQMMTYFLINNKKECQSDRSEESAVVTASKASSSRST